MSLSAWEQQALNTIRDVLTVSDPKLATLLTTFSDLASGEEMPAAERIPPAPWLAARGRHLGWAAAGLWLLITMALISIALVLNGAGDGNGSCPRSWVTACASPAPAHDSRPATEGDK